MCLFCLPNTNAALTQGYLQLHETSSKRNAGRATRHSRTARLLCRATSSHAGRRLRMLLSAADTCTDSNFESFLELQGGVTGIFRKLQVARKFS